MSEYTPTTEQVRDAYVRAMRNAFIASAGEHRDEFDRWLVKLQKRAADRG
jgi:rubrerythrin